MFSLARCPPSALDLAVPSSLQTPAEIMKRYPLCYRRASNANYFAGNMAEGLMAERGTVYPSRLIAGRPCLYVTGGAAEISLVESTDRASRCAMAVGGGPMLLWRGERCNIAQQIVAGQFSGLRESERIPRVAVGIGTTGHVLHLVTDSMTLAGVQAALLAQDCVDAMALDGGGSVVLIEGGKVTYRADPQWMRKVPSALVMREVVPTDTDSTVMFDLGHGYGGDKGAVANGLREADVVTAIGSFAACFLTEHNVEVLFTGRRSLADRWRECNYAEPDCFIMIHVNAAQSPQANGIETIHYHSSSSGRMLADDLLIETVRATGLAKRPYAPLGVTKYVKGADGKIKQRTGWYQGLWLTDCPACIIEVGFITNVRDAEYLLDPQNRRAAAYGIAQGLLNWLGGR